MPIYSLRHVVNMSLQFFLLDSSSNSSLVPSKYYYFFFHRKSESDVDLPFVTTSFPLPVVNIEHIPVSIDLRLPAYGSVKQLLPLCYIIHNRTSYPQEMEVSMEPNDSFMFAGNKQVNKKKYFDNFYVKSHDFQY